MTRLLVAYVLIVLPAVTVQAADPWHLTKVQMVSHQIRWALASTPHGEVLLRTADGGKEWRNVSPHEIWPLSPQQAQANADVGAEGIDFCFLDRKTGWVAMKDDQDRVVVERTRDAGRTWDETRFVDQTGYFVFISFLDSRHGWLLTISDMASGSTRKELYRTEDSGRTWAAVTDAIPDHIDPTDMTFRSASEGWLAAGYHGSDEVPFYHTVDGGRTWHLQRLLEPAVYRDGGYGNTNPPQFFGPQKRDGVLVVDYRNNTNNRFETITYITRNDGRTWRIGRRRRIKE